MNATFTVYIDESGDEGFSFGKFGEASSDWFVISAVIARVEQDLEIVKLVNRVRVQLGKPSNKLLHFRDLKHEQRIFYVSEIAKAELRTVSILLHKPSLKEPEKFQERYHLYFYATRYLLERVSWYCRDHHNARDSGDGSADIMFSNRSGMSYEDLREYLNILKEDTGLFDVRIDWSIIKPHPDHIKACNPGKQRGLLIPDAVAGSFFYAVQKTQYGFTEDRYAKILKPVVYHRQGRYFGYGLKLWPRDIDETLKSDQSLYGLLSEYQ